MKITILTKSEARHYIPSGPAVAIRIDDIYPMKPLKGSYIEEIQFFFSDIDYEMDYSIKDSEAEEIFNFIDKYSDIEEFVIHCVYAKGRSPAIGYFISQYFNLNQINISDYGNYNKLVLSKLINININKTKYI